MAGDGQGCLIFDSGIIYGIDEGEGKYDGTYQYNDTTCLVDVMIKISMPAGTTSVLGIENPYDWSMNIMTAIDPNINSGSIVVKTVRLHIK